MGDAFTTTPRARLSEQQRARLFLAAEARCALCTRKIMAGEVWHADHVRALVNGGSNETGNLQVVCKNCHTDKTRADHREASKGRRQAVKHLVPREYRSATRFRRPPGVKFNWRTGRYVR